MNNLNLCIDIDGTITNPYYWLDMTNKYFNKNITEEQITKYYIHEVMNITRDEYEEFYEKSKFELHTNPELRADVKAVINRLSLFNTIYFVTARDESLTMLTYAYLKNKGIHYDNLFLLGSHYKVEKAKELNCSIFIEDNYDNAIQLSEAGFKVLLLDTNYNRKKLNDNIIRVYNWNEIFSIIKKLSLRREAV